MWESGGLGAGASAAAGGERRRRQRGRPERGRIGRVGLRGAGRAPPATGPETSPLAGEPPGRPGDERAAWERGGDGRERDGPCATGSADRGG